MKPAQFETQEPVACVGPWYDGRLTLIPRYSHQIFEREQPLYTTPPQRTWVGLTDEEIDAGLLRTNYAMQTAGAWRDGVEWAQSQLKEKNT